MSDPDYLSGASGFVRRPRIAALGDALLDRDLARRRVPAQLAAAAAAVPPRRVLAVAIVREDLPGEWPGARAELERTRHDLEVRTSGAGDRGKFANLNALLDGAEAFDWVLALDDDVALPAGLIDGLLAVAEHLGFALAQPAHRLASHAAWAVTRRRRGVVARQTRFVEIGPVTLFSPKALSELLPFPDLRWGWGLDAHWAALAEARGWPVGVVDALPVGHITRAAGATYSKEAAIAEAGEFLRERPYVPRARLAETVASYRTVAAAAGSPAREGRRRRRVLPARRRPGARRVGPPPGARRARRRRRRARARAPPARAPEGGAGPPRPGCADRPAAPAAARRARRPAGHLRALPRPASRALLRALGRVGGATLALALRRLRRDFAPDLVHAHYAVPAGEAVRRAAPGAPLVISEHGGDVLWLARQGAAGRAAVQRAFAHARLVLPNSTGIERRCRELGAARTRVVHLGADLVDPRAVETPPRLVALGHLVARKRHADVLRALPALPTAVFDVIGDGPERLALEALAARLGVADRVRFRGALAPAAARAALPGATALVLPSEDEAFGVAYVEAMAAGVPAVALAGQDGPEDIAAAGEGLVRVAPRDPGALAAALRALIEDRAARDALGAAARATAQAAFSWEACGRATVDAYAEALR